MNAIVGCSFVVLSMFLFTVTYALFKAASPYLPNTLILFFQNVVSWALVAPFAFRKGLATKHFPLILLRTLFGVITMYCISMAVRTVDLSLVVLLNNTAPLFVPIIVLFWHKTKLPPKIWMSLIIGFFGVMLILRPGFEKVNGGLILALISGLSSGSLLVITRQIAHESYVKILFYYFLIFCVVLAPFLFVEWTSPPVHIWAFLVIAGIAIIGAQLTFTAGMRLVASHEAAPFIYSSVIFSLLLGWFFWKETPNLLSILGMVIVCIGGVLSILFNRKKVV